MTTAKAEMTAYVARHGLSGADLDFALAHGDRRCAEGREASAALVDAAAAKCRAGGGRLDSYDLGMLAARLRNHDNGDL
jgi:hypothetical protein